jgi:hypothetical protein
VEIFLASVLNSGELGRGALVRFAYAVNFWSRAKVAKDAKERRGTGILRGAETVITETVIII